MMKTTEPRATHLKDYRPPAYRITDVELDFHLDGQATRVTAIMQVERLAARARTLAARRTAPEADLDQARRQAARPIGL